MNTQPGPEASDGDADDQDWIDSTDAFASLVSIDIVDGELVPRRRSLRR